MFLKKYISILISLVILSLPAALESKKNGADNKVLKIKDNDNKYIRYGFYFSAYMQAAQFRAGWGSFCGARGVVLIDHVFAIGAGLGLSIYTGENCFYESGIDKYKSKLYNSSADPGILYGGGYAAYHFFTKHIVNISIGCLAGGGNIGRHHLDGTRGTFIIVEPELYIYFNLSAIVRMGVGTSYRYTWGVDYNGISDIDFRGFAISLSLQAGFF